MSRVGSSPIAIPSGVDVSIKGSSITVKGSRGTLERQVPDPITVRQDDGQILV